jgi:peptidoglycan hydrolase CwlO-like protein
MKVNLQMLVMKLEKRITELEEIAHEPQNYKEKCDAMEARIEALEEELQVHYLDEAIKKQKKLYRKK